MHTLEMCIIYVTDIQYAYTYIYIYIQIDKTYIHLCIAYISSVSEAPSFHKPGTPRNVPYTILTHSHMMNRVALWMPRFTVRCDGYACGHRAKHSSGHCVEPPQSVSFMKL